METLRERKKQRTREALLRTALEMFTAQGYDDTTVDDIARAVDVSQRTFFRYFAGKEEAALALQDMTVARLLEAVRERPAHEAPMDALRQAVLEGWDTLNEVIEAVAPVEVFLRMYQVIESTPVLLAAHLRRSVEIEEALARILADREGVDLAADPRPRLTVAVFGGVMRLTERRWSGGRDHSLDALRTLAVSHLEGIGPALSESWRTH
ncbi:TetR family transcriptional regulator [Streptomyces zinciresistens K42]|uniref:TetR family transcriptional regulator n=1 Tax=Streptomyces zinciresistens K42 TaxID=700597 RepID=G2GGH9_9ACTN|nr:TetR family transcriptional regulator [Streptomyces zinciresistens]EGX57367.1 TetR family transcriptional regulator [Streptomyces zinciresistens K42]